MKNFAENLTNPTLALPSRGGEIIFIGNKKSRTKKNFHPALGYG